MGAVVSDVSKGLDTNDESARRAKEQLEIIVKLADARLDVFESELRTASIDRDSAMNPSLPRGRALRLERHCLVDTETEVSAQVTPPFP